jgi:hypothetical protein
MVTDKSDFMYYKILFSFLFFLLNYPVKAQPYLDLLNIRYSNSPNAGLIRQKNASVQLNYLSISTTLPLLLKNKDAFILSPFFERWKAKMSDNNSHYYSFVLPVSFLKVIDDRWSFVITGILRMNDSSITMQMKRQVGGAVIVNYKKSATLTYKMGAYVNDEFFGLFLMPLFGIDWQIDKKNVLFGVLPGNLTYQHTLSKNLAYGLAFRAQTNSYNRSYDRFTRIDENQLGAYVDFYLNKQFVLNLEGGHSLFRKIRSEKMNDCNCSGKYYDYGVNDNVYIKASFAYRISLRAK